MSRATGDFIDSNIDGSLPYGDAIVSGLNDSLRDFDGLGFANVHAIGIRTICRGSDMKIANPKHFAICNMHVESHAVQ